MNIEYFARITEVELDCGRPSINVARARIDEFYLEFACILLYLYLILCKCYFCQCVTN